MSSRRCERGRPPPHSPFPIDWASKNWWVAVRMARTGACGRKRIARFCQKNLPPRFQPMHYVRLPAIPRNQLGKVERRRLPELCGIPDG